MFNIVLVLRKVAEHCMRLPRSCLAVCKARDIIAIKKLRNQWLEYLLEYIKIILVFLKYSIKQKRMLSISIWIGLIGNIVPQTSIIRVYYLQYLITLPTNIHLHILTILLVRPDSQIHTEGPWTRWFNQAFLLLLYFRYLGGRITFPLYNFLDIYFE